MLVASLDESAEVASGTQSYLYFGTRLLYGWTLQLVLVFALIPFLAATVDLFARCRRRHIALRARASQLPQPAGGLALAGARLRALHRRRPPAQRRGPADRARHPAAGDWPVAALGALLGVSALAWLVVRPRLTATRSISRAGGARRPPGGDARARGRRPRRRRRQPLLAASSCCRRCTPGSGSPSCATGAAPFSSPSTCWASPGRSSCSPRSRSASRWGSTRSGTCSRSRRSATCRCRWSPPSSPGAPRPARSGAVRSGRTRPIPTSRERTPGAVPGSRPPGDSRGAESPRGGTVAVDAGGGPGREPVEQRA